MHTITNLRQNVSSGCQGALHPQARFGGQLGLKIPAFRSEMAGPTARRWANMQFYLRPSGGQGRYPLHMGIGLLHICTAVRFLHSGGVTNLTIYTNLSHAAKLPPKLSAQPVTEKLESAIIGVTANPHCRQLQEREPDEPNNSKRRSPCPSWCTGIAAGRLRHGAAVCPRTGIHSAGTRYPDHELVGGRCPHRNLPAGHPGI